MKTGFVTIIGRPNVGKSSLVNTILDFNLAIISPKPQTTRNQIKGIYSTNDTQIVFLDTPGIHKPKQKLGISLNNAAYKSLENIDLVAFLTPVDEKIGPGDRYIIDKIKDIENKIAIITKVDIKHSKEEIEKKALSLKAEGFKSVLGISINQNKDEFMKIIIKEMSSYLKEGEPYFPIDQVTDLSTSFMSEEIIRESIIENVFDEVPHSISVVINEFKEEEDNILIDANIFVERNSQKGILIGKNGKQIKKIGTTARKKIQNLVGKKVFLQLFVKVDKNWTKNELKIKNMGY
ncbi:MAG: GTPase Era [Mycoplasma sp.]|nr:GTPase Era [Mycoplasma sp.]